MKNNRHERIIELITNEDIETQEELAAKLIEAGFSVTQATVSRDIKQLGLTKVKAKSGRQKYVESKGFFPQNQERMGKMLSEGVISFDDASKLLVIKTMSGMAMAVATSIDAMRIPNLVGCIAGDDTVFCAIKDEESLEMVKEILKERL